MSTLAAPNAYGVWKDDTPIDPKPPEVAKTNLGDVVKGDRPIGDVINWCYKNIVAPMLDRPNEDLYDLLVKPLAGDFNRIRANGDAWATAARMYETTGRNLTKNSAVLVDRDWHGAAADAFNGLTQLVWAGALFVAQKSCEWMQKGFAKLADVSIRIATRCVQLLEKIFEMLGKLGKKLIPGLGQLISIFEWIESDFDKTPYIHEAEEIVHLIGEVIGLYDSLERLIEGINGYLDQIGAIADAVGKVPSIGNMNDAAEVGRQLQESKKKMDENRKKVGEASQQIDAKLADLDKHAQ